MLTPLGRRQATAAGRMLSLLLAGLGRSRFDVVLSSPFRRALETTVRVRRGTAVVRLWWPLSSVTFLRLAILSASGVVIAYGLGT